MPFAFDFLATTSGLFFLRGAALILLLGLACLAFLRVYKAIKENRITAPRIVKWVFIIGTALILVWFAFSGVATPKGVISIPKPRVVVEEPVNIEIVTPPPRVQILDGFVPLGESNK